MAARKRPGLSENTRQRIKTSMIVNRLTDHILGKCELSATQVSSALGLLRKTLPDLASVEMKAEVTTTDAKQLSDSELASIAVSSSTGAARQKGGEKKLDKLH